MSEHIDASEWTSLPGGLTQNSIDTARIRESHRIAMQYLEGAEPREDDTHPAVTLEINGDEMTLQAFSWMDGEEYWHDVTEEDLRRNGWVRKEASE